MLRSIDLFAGCGGFSCGFMQAGIKVDTAVEIDETIAISYRHNHKNTTVIIDDIKNIDNNKYFKKYQADIIIGGPPCQGFSTAGARIRHYFVDDPRNYLFKHYLNIVKLVKPKIFIFENVKGIVHYKNGDIFKEIKRAFQEEGYVLQYFIPNAKDFGIPQARERTILIGSVKDFSLPQEIEETKKFILRIMPDFFKPVNVWDAIGNLPAPTNSGEIENLKPKNSYEQFVHSKGNTIRNHISTRHNPTAIQRMSKVKENENFIVLNERIKSIHSGSYGRLSADKVAPTITTRFDTPSGGRFIHPLENRTITPREAARLQSFPDSFEFLGTKTSICKQIGNAVPPKLAYFLGIMIRILLNDR